MSKHSPISLLCVALVFILSCRHSPQPQTKIPYGGYPDDVGAIITTKCVDGCHDPVNKSANGGLVLDTWEHMFDGAANGAVVVPYDTGYSSLLYFINTDISAGLVVAPTMPYNGKPLAKDEYKIIKDWIAKGAPDRNGVVPFSTNPDTRQKVYLTLQGCNMVGVIDAEKKVVMRYLHFDKIMDATPHVIHVSPDGMFAYVGFAPNGDHVYKIDTKTDKVVGSINLNQDATTTASISKSWNAFCFFGQNQDSIAITSIDGAASKAVAFSVDEMQHISPIGELYKLHGIAVAPENGKFYITTQTGNYINIAGLDLSHEAISLNGKAITTDSASSPDPHEIVRSPDGKKYFITAEHTNQLIITDAQLHVLDNIAVAAKPQEIAISPKMHCIYVTCQEGPEIQVGKAKFKGSVYVINYDDHSVKGIIDKLSQPHGVCIDERNNLIFIPSRNVSQDGPAPHHTSDCAGRNGYYQVYDLATLQPVDGKRYEVTPDPYACDIRFK